MKKWLIGILISIVFILSSVIGVQYFGVKYSDWPSNQANLSLTPKEKQAMARRLGISVADTLPDLSEPELNNALDDIVSLGFTWVRFDMSWRRVQPENYKSYHWQDLDRVIKAANKRKLNLLPILTYAPDWVANPPKKNYMKPSLNQVKFAGFAKEAAKRYAPMGINHWEIWNEPNLKDLWQPNPNPKDYTDLLKKTYLNIKEIDPDAIVISGGIAPIRNEEPGRMSALGFLEGIYTNGGKNYFDAVGYHPTSYPQLPSAIVARNGWAQMDRPFFKSIRSIMKDNGDSRKDVWATEFATPTKGVDGVNESFQVKMVQDVAQQMKSKPWIKVLFWYSYKDLRGRPIPAENYFGLVRADGTKKPAYYTMKKLLN